MPKQKDFTELIRPLCREHKVIWTHHAAMRLLMRGIPKSDVENVLLHGRIIEKYPSDYPFPSCLILGGTSNGEPLHVVCSIHSDPNELHIVTAYVPSIDDWEYDFKTRRK